MGRQLSVCLSVATFSVAFCLPSFSADRICNRIVDSYSTKPLKPLTLVKIKNLTVGKQSVAGTLVIAGPTKEGLVLMTDRLGVSSERDFDVDKMLTAGDSTVVTSTGLTARVEGAQISFSVNHFVVKWLKEHSGSELSELAQTLAEAYVHAVPSAAMRRYIRSHVDTTGFLFQLVVFHSDQVNKILQYRCIKFIFIDEVSSKISWNITSYEEPFFVRSFGFEGLTEFIREKRYIPYSDEFVYPLISYFSDPSPQSNVEVRSAVSDLARMFLLSLESEKRLKAHSIGPIVDVGILSPKTGFKWLQRKVNINELIDSKENEVHRD